MYLIGGSKKSLYNQLQRWDCPRCNCSCSNTASIISDFEISWLGNEKGEGFGGVVQNNCKIFTSWTSVLQLSLMDFKPNFNRKHLGNCSAVQSQIHFHMPTLKAPSSLTRYSSSRNGKHAADGPPLGLAQNQRYCIIKNWLVLQWQELNSTTEQPKQLYLNYQQTIQLEQIEKCSCTSLREWRVGAHSIP